MSSAARDARDINTRNTSAVLILDSFLSVFHQPALTIPAEYRAGIPEYRAGILYTDTEYRAGIKIPKKIGIPAWYSGIPEVAGIPVEYRAGFLPERSREVTI